eukprot:m.60172 g.60172  ORF g.60172 m.60172 type:complete len:735 (-) comp12278_c0_seq1:24-2228(-)
MAGAPQDYFFMRMVRKCGYVGCDRLFAAEEHILDHIPSHYDRRSISWRCRWTGCSAEAFPLLDELIDHVRQTHEGPLIKVCVIQCDEADCGSCFTAQFDLATHKNMDHEPQMRVRAKRPATDNGPASPPRKSLSLRTHRSPAQQLTLSVTTPVKTDLLPKSVASEGSSVVPSPPVAVEGKAEPACVHAPNAQPAMLVSSALNFQIPLFLNLPSPSPATTTTNGISALVAASTRTMSPILLDEQSPPPVAAPSRSPPRSSNDLFPHAHVFPPVYSSGSSASHAPANRAQRSKSSLTETSARSVEKERPPQTHVRPPLICLDSSPSPPPPPSSPPHPAPESPLFPRVLPLELPTRSLPLSIAPTSIPTPTPASQSRPSTNPSTSHPQQRNHPPSPVSSSDSIEFICKGPLGGATTLFLKSNTASGTQPAHALSIVAPPPATTTSAPSLAPARALPPAPTPASTFAPGSVRMPAPAALSQAVSHAPAVSAPTAPLSLSASSASSTHSATIILADPGALPTPTVHSAPAAHPAPTAPAKVPASSVLPTPAVSSDPAKSLAPSTLNALPASSVPVKATRSPATAKASTPSTHLTPSAPTAPIKASPASTSKRPRLVNVFYSPLWLPPPVPLPQPLPSRECGVCHTLVDRGTFCVRCNASLHRACAPIPSLPADTALPRQCPSCASLAATMTNTSKSFSIYSTLPTQFSLGIEDGMVRVERLGERDDAPWSCGQFEPPSL